MEIRDKLKQIDQHLSKHHEIDTSRVENVKARKRRSDGKRLKDALTVANETKNAPFNATEEVLTFDERREFAQRGRSRVQPPLDHAPTIAGAGARGMGGGRRASVGNAAAMQAALKEAEGHHQAQHKGSVLVQKGDDASRMSTLI